MTSMKQQQPQEPSGVHLRVWTVLENLPTGERMVGHKLMNATGITNERQFHGIIETLRTLGYPIAASKGLHNPGYYRMTTDREAWNYHFQTVLSKEKEIEWITDNTERFFLEKHGPAFDFIQAKNKEELKRFEQQNNPIED